MSILAASDFIDKAEFYGIPDLKFPRQIARLTATINFAEIGFLKTYSITDHELTEDEVDNSDELTEALTYYTFSKWLRLEWLERTPHGASVERQQVKGTPTYDVTREAAALNRCIDLVNDNYPVTLETDFEKLNPFINY